MITMMMMNMMLKFFFSNANKIYVHNKGFSPCVILKAIVWNSEAVSIAAKRLMRSLHYTVYLL